MATGQNGWTKTTKIVEFIDMGLTEKVLYIVASYTYPKPLAIPDKGAVPYGGL